MAEVKLRSYQIQSRDAALKLTANESTNRVVLMLPTGSGKCHGIDTPVMLASGAIVPVQDVVVGDLLMGDDGTPRTVLSTTTGTDELYRVTQVRGESYVVNSAHILSLRKTVVDHVMTLANGVRIPDDQELVDVDVMTYMASNKTAKHCLKGYRSGLVESFLREQAELPIDPYCLGAWLGDGRLTSWTLFKAENTGMMRRWIAYAEACGMRVRIEQQRGCVAAHVVKSGDKNSRPNIFIDKLDSMRLREAKHIPPAYKYGSVETRRQIIAGMIDSDGSISHGGCDWISKSKRMAEDFSFVCRSLGLACYLSEQTKGIKSIGFTAQYWRASVSGDLSELPMLDKKAMPREQKKRHLVHGIDIQPIGHGKYFGFQIDGNHRYLLGDFTVTHNSVIATDILKRMHEEGRRGAFIVPRTALIDQFSAHLDHYGIPHGVIQADHWRYRPHEFIQLCSAQTLARRGFPEGLEAVVIDEGHLMFKAIIEFLGANKHIPTIALTATPFAKGMADIYSDVVCEVTQNQLIQQGHLVPLKVYIGVSASMEKILVKSTGEWDEKEMSAAQSELVGDLLTEWEDKCLREFGGPAKTIAFGPTVDYCEALKATFSKAGHRFEVVSYKDDKDARKDLFVEFKKPDSKIMGLISCEALREGFDVPDVMVLIDAHPYRKSRQAVIQMHGRVMRPAPDKKYGLLLDHSGNYLRHLKFLEKVAERGIHALKGGLKENDEKFKPEKEADVAKKSKERTCPKCNSLLKLFSSSCSDCGWVKPVVPKVVQATGKMMSLEDAKKLSKGKLTKTERTEQNKQFASLVDSMPALELQGQLKAYAMEKWGSDPVRAKRWVNANYMSRRGTWPQVTFENMPNIPPSPVLLADIAARQKLWAVQQQFKRHG